MNWWEVGQLQYWRFWRGIMRLVALNMTITSTSQLWTIWPRRLSRHVPASIVSALDRQ